MANGFAETVLSPTLSSASAGGRRHDRDFNLGCCSRATSQIAALVAGFPAGASQGRLRPASVCGRRPHEVVHPASYRTVDRGLAMSIKAIPPRSGKTPYWYGRGSYLGVSIDR